jgi:hypothetical protein
MRKLWLRIYTALFTFEWSTSCPESEDLGVAYLDTEIQLVRVGGAPGKGQYSFRNGVYIFARSDRTRPLQIDYLEKAGRRKRYGQWLISSPR